MVEYSFKKFEIKRTKIALIGMPLFYLFARNEKVSVEDLKKFAARESYQVTISDFAETKIKYLVTYEKDVRKNLRKFMPYYEEFDAKTYFDIFDKEYFRVIF